MAEHQPQTPPPSPRPFASSQGGIIGPQPGQQLPHPSTPTSPTPGATPGTPIPKPVPSQKYGTEGQPPGSYGSPGAMPYVSAQQQPLSSKTTFVDSRPIRARRFSPALIFI